MRQRQETIGPIVTRALDCAAHPWLVQYIAPGLWTRTESEHDTREAAETRMRDLLASAAPVPALSERGIAAFRRRNGLPVVCPRCGSVDTSGECRACAEAELPGPTPGFYL